MDFTRDNIKDAITQSQHCQRNWDLSKQIPDDDIDTIITAITQCPSKQNIAHYAVHVITNRNLIEQIHEHTVGFTIGNIVETNSQVLANLLLVFEEIGVDVSNSVDANRNDETRLIASGQADAGIYELLKRDKYMSLGIASGYANIIANMLGYNTGYCACFAGDQLQKILNTDNQIALMLGIGYKNDNIDRRMHQLRPVMFGTRTKQKIKVSYYK
jgi:nitroreductase